MTAMPFGRKEIDDRPHVRGAAKEVNDDHGARTRRDLFGDRLGRQVAGQRSMSANMGTQFASRIGIAVPMSDIAVVMISSHGSGLTGATATWIATCPDVDATAFGAP
jgi:hypothetical protein